MTIDKIQFTKEKETMLMMLNGRAIQSQWKNPILHDPIPVMVAGPLPRPGTQPHAA